MLPVTQELLNRIGPFGPDPLPELASETSKEAALRPGDVIVTMTDLSKNGDTLGYSAIVPETRLSRASVSLRFTMTMSAFGKEPLTLVRWKVSGSDPVEMIGAAGGGSGSVGLTHETELAATPTRLATPDNANANRSTEARRWGPKRESFGAQRRRTRAIATA